LRRGSCSRREPCRRRWNNGEGRRGRGAGGGTRAYGVDGGDSVGVGCGVCQSCVRIRRPCATGICDQCTPCSTAVDRPLDLVPGGCGAAVLTPCTPLFLSLRRGSCSRRESCRRRWSDGESRRGRGAGGGTRTDGVDGGDPVGVGCAVSQSY